MRRRLRKWQSANDDFTTEGGANPLIQFATIGSTVANDGIAIRAEHWQPDDSRDSITERASTDTGTPSAAVESTGNEGD